MEKGFIYGLIDPETERVRYIGQTIQTLHRRLNKHLSDCERNTRHVSCWLRGLKTRGLKAKIVLFEECDLNLLDQQEIFYIKKYKDEGHDLTNISEGGQVIRIISQETKDKISNTLKGHKQSKETIEKRRQTAIETWKSPELRELKSQQTKKLNELGVIGTKGKPSKKKGKPFTGDRQKLLEAAKKRFDNVDIRNKVAIANGQKPFLVYKGKVLLRANRFRKEPVIERGELVMEHINVNEVCRLLGIKHPINVRKCLRGKRNIVEGLIFIYK